MFSMHEVILLVSILRPLCFSSQQAVSVCCHIYNLSCQLRGL